jgi:hypothetical protein
MQTYGFGAKGVVSVVRLCGVLSVFLPSVVFRIYHIPAGLLIW